MVNVQIDVRYMLCRMENVCNRWKLGGNCTICCATTKFEIFRIVRMCILMVLTIKTDLFS